MSNDDMSVTRGSATRSRAPMLGEDVSFGYSSRSHKKMSFKPFCKSLPPHRPVILSFAMTNIKNKLTDLCRN